MFLIAVFLAFDNGDREKIKKGHPKRNWGRGFLKKTPSPILAFFNKSCITLWTTYLDFPFSSWDADFLFTCRTLIDVMCLFLLHHIFLLHTPSAKLVSFREVCLIFGIALIYVF